MVVLVRCIDDTVSVALASKLDILMSEGLITAYLAPDGWVKVRNKKTKDNLCIFPPQEQRYHAFVSCSETALSGLVAAQSGFSLSGRDALPCASAGKGMGT